MIRRHPGGNARAGAKRNIARLRAFDTARGGANPMAPTVHSKLEVELQNAGSAPAGDRAAVMAACRRAYPDLQAVYLFGSRASGESRPRSDFDLALLLPFESAREAECLPLSPLRSILERDLGQEVDLVNLRIVPTVFAKEIVATGERIDCADPAAADDFEAITFSLYQELNVERAGILRDFEEAGLAFAPETTPRRSERP
jgi:predicted nucleotidyltransferase